MEDWNGFMMSKSNGFGVMTSSSSTTTNNNEEFEEDDVLWNSNTNAHVKETHQYPHDYEDHSSHTMNKLIISSGSSSTAWKVSTTPRKIPRRAHNNNNNNNSVIGTQATTRNEGKKVAQAIQQQSSAPMKIPDWSKIYGKNNDMGSWDNNYNSNKYDELDHIEDHDHDHGYGDDDDDDMVPPHEWIARKLARSQISSFSVCEGIGRTLKGRDLSKVRNAILTKTGFLE